jgi:hypothetical protein
MECAEDLHVGSADAVVWVIGGDVRECGCSTDGALARVGDIDWVAVLGLSQPVDVIAVRKIASNVIERPVLLYKDDNMLDAT